MNKEEIQALFSQFEQVSCVLNDIECWSARELCSLLGYSEWRNFLKVINKAKETCKNVNQDVFHHFVDVNKMVEYILVYILTGLFCFIYNFKKITPFRIS